MHRPFSQKQWNWVRASYPRTSHSVPVFTRALFLNMTKGRAPRRPPLRLIELWSNEGDASIARVGLNRVDEGTTSRLNAATRVAASFCRAGIMCARPEVRTLLKKTWIKHCRPYFYY